MQIFFCFFNLGGIYLVIIYLKHPSDKHRLSDQKKRKKNKYKGRLYTKMTKARKKGKKSASVSIIFVIFGRGFYVNQEILSSTKENK